jgi:hypothetical protein
MDVTPIDDGFGRQVGDRSPMPGKPGSHVAYARGSDLVVEWYDFGDGAPYESANLMIFDRPTQLRLAQAIGIDPSLSPHMLANNVAARFDSSFDVKRYAEAHDLGFTTEVDYQP